MLRALAFPLLASLLATAQASGPRLVVQESHRAEVVAVAISEDASLAASLDAEGDVKVWVLPEGRLFFTLPAIQPRPRGLALEDGVLFVSAAGRTRAWDLYGGFEVELPKEFEPPEPSQAKHVAAPDGRRLSASEQGLSFSPAEGEEPVRLEGRALAPVAVDWGPAGPRALYAEGALLTWSAEGAPERARVEAEEPADFAALVDGERLLIGDGGGPARLVRAETGEELHRFAGHVGHLRAVAADPDQRRAVTGSSKGDVIAWDLVSQSAYRVLPAHKAAVSALSWGPGERVATGGMDGVARLVRLDTGEVLAEAEGHQAGVRAVAISPDGGAWLSGDGGGALRAWSSDGALSFTLESPDPVGALAWTPDGAAFFVARGGVITLHAAGDGAELKRLEAGAAEIRRLVVHQGGERLLSGDAEGWVRAWSLQDDALLWEIQAHESPVTLLGADDDAQRVLSGGPKGGVRRWKADSGREDGVGPKRAVAAGALSADGQRLVLGRSAGGLGIWRPEGWVFLGRLEGDAAGAPVVAALSDGELVLTGGDAGYLRSWHAASGSMISRARHSRPLTAVTTSADGEWAASGDVDGGVLLWEVDRAANVREIEGFKSPVTALAFSDDADVLWVGDARGRVHRVPLVEGERQTWVTHRGPVRALSAGPEGALLSVGQGGRAQRWQGAEAVETAQVGRPIVDAAWSPDGARLLFAEPGRLEIWDAAPLALRCTLVAGPEGWRVAGADGAQAGAGEDRLAHWVEAGALRELRGGEDPALLEACLTP